MSAAAGPSRRTPRPSLDATVAAYDAVAARYAELFRDSLAGQVLDRAAFTAFAELVRSSGPGPVAEAGCGPGHVTAHLRDLGLDAFGVDLSPAMIAIARRTHPGIRFDLAPMDALDAPAGTLGGVVAWYSLIHLPPDELPRHLAAFHRALRPGGCLLLGFFASDAENGPVTGFDHKVAPAHRWPVDALAALATAAGFTEAGRLRRPPDDGERFPQARLLLRRAA
ncbi:class I SAM-dependent methyltransferase [Streptomyces sp. ODS05-4]|uniref:class I SAM-dependent DNA methyltransferase n=1 Tax=Streptomyces sp. ODS05-4 TaxID=2944939 RepID=UPI00210A95A5|nr:class I SAM-dependent methyltransferase [Streptomyces sp. ODS05-4]